MLLVLIACVLDSNQRFRGRGRDILPQQCFSLLVKGVHNLEVVIGVGRFLAGISPYRLLLIGDRWWSLYH